MKVFIGKFPKKADRERKIKIQIDPWDTWSMDHTLAHIIVPMLKQLKATQHGAPRVDLEDVPEELRVEKLTGEYDVDENYFKRWEYVLDEMIFAFENKLTHWEDQFWKVKPELDLENPIDTESIIDSIGVEPLRWKTLGECDEAGRNAYQARISNGFRLFGKYYEGLWD